MYNFLLQQDIKKLTQSKEHIELMDFIKHHKPWKLKIKKLKESLTELKS